MDPDFARLEFPRFNRQEQEPMADATAPTAAPRTRIPGIWNLWGLIDYDPAPATTPAAPSSAPITPSSASAAPESPKADKPSSVHVHVHGAKKTAPKAPAAPKKEQAKS